MRSTKSEEVLRRLFQMASMHLGRLLHRSTRWIKHILVWALLMIGVTWLQDSLGSGDWTLVNLLDRGTAPWPAGVEVIDLGWDQDPLTVEAFRGDLAGALKALAELETPPKVVVVDVAVSRLPLGLGPLNAAVRALKERQVDIVAAVDSHGFSAVLDFDDALRRQGKGRQAYAGLADFGHTALTYDGNAYWYHPCLPVPSLWKPDQQDAKDKAAVAKTPDPCLPAVPYLVGKRFWPASQPPTQAPTARAQPVRGQHPAHAGDPGGLRGAAALWHAHRIRVGQFRRGGRRGDRGHGLACVAQAPLANDAHPVMAAQYAPPDCPRLRTAVSDVAARQVSGSAQLIARCRT